MKQKETGITLIALVVTIVVLLILAGTSISILAGENGIITKASNARENTRGGEVKERVDMAANENKMANYANGTRKSKQNVIDELKAEGKLTDEEVVLLKTQDIITIGNIEIDFSILNMADGEDNIDFDTILADVSENYDEYLLKAQEKGQTTETNIGIGTDGEVVNLDLWHYYKTDDGEGVSLGTRDGSGYRVGYDNENVIDGKIQGKVPQYIYISVENKNYSVLSMSYTFGGCSSLIQAPEIPSSVTSMEKTFYECSSLIQTPEIPSSVTSMVWTFYNCSSLTQAPKIPSSVTSMDKTFSECSSLIQAPEIPSSVTNMNETFYNCRSLTQAPIIPSSVKNMTYTFSGCTSLTGTVTINADPTVYTDCFEETTKPITLTGTSTMLSALAGTANNGNVTY